MGEVGIFVIRDSWIRGFVAFLSRKSRKVGIFTGKEINGGQNLCHYLKTTTGLGKQVFRKGIAGAEYGVALQRVDG